MALDFQRPDPSSPAAVASAQFTMSRRGYREEEVRDFLRQVSVELARLLERERFLESELKALQARGPVDVAAIDEAAVTELLGAEAARVLTSAREAAQAMRDRAAESAEQIVRDATREAARLLEESTVEASRRRSDVSGEAEQELELAKQQGREMIAEVRAYRERVLTDLAKRTEEARRDLERLVHERERLLGAFERARHAATDVVGDLNEFDQTLRGTGVTPPLVPPDAPPPPRPTRGSDTPIFDAKEYAHELGVAHRDANEEVAEVDVTEVVVTEAVVTEGAGSPAVDTPSSAETPLEHEATPTSEVSQEVGISRETGIPPTRDNPEHIAEVVNIFDRQRKRENSRSTPANDAPEHPVFERVQAQPEDEPQAPITNRVDEIFARLRTSSTDRVAKAVVNDLVDSDNEPDESAPESSSLKINPPAVRPPGIDESVFRRRDEVVTPAVEAMTRALKRQLVDDENAVLVHVRAKRTSLTLDAMFASVVEHTQRYERAVHEAAIGVAVDAARSRSDSRRADLRSTIARGGVVEAISEMLSNDLLRPLHERIAAAIDAASGDRDALAVVLRSLFQEWKSQRLSLVIADIAHFTYARGLFLGCDGSTAVCWAVDPNGPACADAEDNALAGATPHGEKFPTGHQHPLAHAGCRCLVVPLDK
jgi:DivIVA domain-containing protein